MKKTKISAAEFDKKFDRGEDIAAHVDWAKARAVRARQKRVPVSLPPGLARSLDAEASRRGVQRQTLMERWLTEKLAQA